MVVVVCVCHLLNVLLSIVCCFHFYSPEGKPVLRDFLCGWLYFLLRSQQGVKTENTTGVDIIQSKVGCVVDLVTVCACMSVCDSDLRFHLSINKVGDVPSSKKSVQAGCSFALAIHAGVLGTHSSLPSTETR